MTLPHPPQNVPFVSVIIPTFKDSEALAVCLQALHQQTYPREQYEIIVVNNCPAEPLPPSLPLSANTLVEAEWKKGSYAARNRGIQVAKGQVLAFTDADCIPAPDWLASGIQALNQSHRSCDLLAGNIEISVPPLVDCTAFELYELVQAFDQEQYVCRDRYGATANLFVARRVFDAVGLFSEELQSGGDFEWGRRATRQGFSLLYAPQVRITHPARKSLDEMIKKTRRIIKGHNTLMRRDLYPSSRFVLAFFADLLFPYRSIPSIFSNRRLSQFSLKLRVSFVSVLIRYIRAFYRFKFTLRYQLD